MVKKYSINIFGACASRDIFPSDTEYIINQYVSFTNPISIIRPFGGHRLSDKDLRVLSTSSNFQKRCLILDNNKESLDYLTKKPSDYLIIDLADYRMDIVSYNLEFTI